MRLLSTAAVLLVGSLIAAPAANAQMALSVAAGASLPMGDTGDALDMGYNASIGLGIKPPLAPLGVRIEGMFNSFEYKETVATDASHRILGLIANGVLSPPLMPVYAIGGLGMYQNKVSVGSMSSSETDFGFNIGAGVNLPLTGFSTFAELRYHHIPVEGGSIKFLPISVGLRF